MENFKKEIQDVIERVKKYINEFDTENFKKTVTKKINDLREYINSKLNKK